MNDSQLPQPALRTRGRARRGTAVAALATVLLAVAATQSGAAASSGPAASADPAAARSGAVAATSPIAPAAKQPGPTAAVANSGDSVTRLRQEVRAGSLLRGRGVHQVCPRCKGEFVTVRSGSATPLRAPAPAGYGPADLSKAYALPATSSRTGTIAIIDAGVDATLAHDLAAYRAEYGLPACTTASGCLKLENYTGGAQPPAQSKGQGAFVEEEVAVETALDLDMASAACPSCRLLEISVPWQDAQDDNDVSTGDFAQAVDTAVAAHASAISISYGYTADVTNTHGSYLSAFRHKGVAISASSGDAGFNGGIHQDWPSNLPSVTSVGGVTLPASGPATAWWSAGSGCETAFRSAYGQPAAVAAACGGHRAATDVSADADPATGVAVYDTDAPSSGEPNDWMIVGGTSASAPYVAGLYVRAGHQSSIDGPQRLYHAPATDFTDVTSGNNEAFHQCASYPGVSPSLCNAGTGWDGPTGLGIPHGLGAF